MYSLCIYLYIYVYLYVHMYILQEPRRYVIIERIRVSTSVCVRACLYSLYSGFECIVGIAVDTRHRGNDVSVIPWWDPQDYDLQDAFTAGH